MIAPAQGGQAPLFSRPALGLSPVAAPSSTRSSVQWPKYPGSPGRAALGPILRSRPCWVDDGSSQEVSSDDNDVQRHHRQMSL
jgi:hypothetical protein